MKWLSLPHHFNGVEGLHGTRGSERRRVTKAGDRRTVLEQRITEGENPVFEIVQFSLMKHPSTAGHEKSCRNLGGPPPKAKYSLVTDSEPVP